MRNPIARLLLALVLSTAVGWAMLVAGGRTDAAGRMGLALGAAVFALVTIGWGRGRRGWLQGLAGAAVFGGRCSPISGPALAGFREQLR